MNFKELYLSMETVVIVKDMLEYLYEVQELEYVKFCSETLKTTEVIDFYNELLDSEITELSKLNNKLFKNITIFENEIKDTYY
jgi:hypothetical protein